MMELTKEECISCKGGAVSAALLNAVSSLIKNIYGIGQNFGSMIKRLINGTSC